MQWVLMGPKPGSYHAHWVTPFIPASRHQVFNVLTHYHHGAPRDRTSKREWLNYLRHAWRGLRVARLSCDPQVGLLTLFPQVTVMAGLLKRALRIDVPILGWTFNLGHRQGRLVSRIAGWGLASVDLLVVHSRRERAGYAEAFGLPERKFVFVPFGVPRLDPTLAEDAEPFILAMGSANRDYATLVEALRPLGLRLVIVAAPHAVQGLGLPGWAELRQGLTHAECRDLAQRARLNVVPVDNRFSASGQVTVIEAMMLGRCVVATDTIGTEDYVRDGETGVLVPPGDAAALGAAIGRLWADAEERRRLGDAARRHALAHFTHEASAATLAGLCDELQAARGGRAG